MKKIIFQILLLLVFTGCDYVPTFDDVLPDRRTEYKKSEALPDLEVPPDLTTEALEDPLVIPDEQVTTLSEYQKQKSRRQGTISGSEFPLTGSSAEEQWISIPGQSSDFWPKLREFWTEKGYQLDLDDAELGVLETLWQESESDGITTYRNKFKVYAESGQNPGTTVLFISSEREEKISDESGQSDWVAIERDTDQEKSIVGDLNLYFYGTALPAAESTSISSASTAKKVQRKLASIENLDDEKLFLSLPDEFTLAWTRTEDVLNQAGIIVENQEKEKGLYHIIYFPAGSQEKEGLFNKLKFWGDDDEGEKYQVSLTGVGEKTELVVLDEKGEWLEKNKASQLLNLLQLQYNRITH